MGYITFFQFLRRCLQLDAEAHISRWETGERMEDALNRESTAVPAGPPSVGREKELESGPANGMKRCAGDQKQGGTGNESDDCE